MSWAPISTTERIVWSEMGEHARSAREAWQEKRAEGRARAEHERSGTHEKITCEPVPKAAVPSQNFFQDVDTFTNMISLHVRLQSNIKITSVKSYLLLRNSCYQHVQVSVSTDSIESWWGTVGTSICVCHYSCHSPESPTSIPTLSRVCPLLG